MRKVHYRVVLDVFVHEEEEIDGNESLMHADFWPTLDEENIDVMDVTVETVGVSDSR